MLKLKDRKKYTVQISKKDGERQTKKTLRQITFSEIERVTLQ